MLACALGHRVKARFPGGIHWFRWGPGTHAPWARCWPSGSVHRAGEACSFKGLRRFLTRDRGVFIVLDNHEDDRAMARLLDELRDAHAIGSSPLDVAFSRGCRFFRSPRPS